MSNSKGIQKGAQFLQIQKHHSVKNWFYNSEYRKATHGFTEPEALFHSSQFMLFLIKYK